MIKADSRDGDSGWFFYEDDNAIALTIYNPVTDGYQYMLIVEEPTEGGPSIEIHHLSKAHVAAAFGLERPQLDEWIEDFECYDVLIPQIIKEWPSGKYLCGTIGRHEDGKHFIFEAPHTTRYATRADAAADFLSDKGISERILCIKNQGLPF